MHARLGRSPDTLAPSENRNSLQKMGMVVCLFLKRNNPQREAGTTNTLPTRVSGADQLEQQTLRVPPPPCLSVGA